MALNSGFQPMNGKVQLSLTNEGYRVIIPTIEIALCIQGLLYGLRIHYESATSFSWYYGFTERKPAERLLEHNGNHHHSSAAFWLSRYYHNWYAN